MGEGIEKQLDYYMKLLANSNMMMYKGLDEFGGFDLGGVVSKQDKTIKLDDEENELDDIEFVNL